MVDCAMHRTLDGARPAHLAHRRLASLAGFAMIAVAKGAYFHFGWFHGKFTLALVMLALHFVLGARVRAADAAGRTDGVAPQMRVLQLGVLATAALAVICVIVLKSLHAA